MEITFKEEEIEIIKNCLEKMNTYGEFSDETCDLIDEIIEKIKKAEKSEK